MMTFVMYLARCSVMVKTLPWPMGALGPRKANNYSAGLKHLGG